jgi:hypothetical protein
MKNANSDPEDLGSIPPKDIVVRTFDFTVLIIQLCVKLDERPGVGRVLMSQILRARDAPANATACAGKSGFGR